MIEKYPENRYTNAEILIIEKLNYVNQIIRDGGISTDMDSTEWASEKVALELFNNDWKTKKTVKDLKDRYVMLDWLKSYGVKDPLKIALGYWNNLERIPFLEPTSGAYILAKYFNSEDLKMRRETARPDFTRMATYECYKRTMPWVSKDLIGVQDNGENIDAKKKIKRLKERDIHYHFDDAPDDAEMAAKVGIVTSLVPQTWNEGYESKSPLVLSIKNAYDNGLPNLGVSGLKLREFPKMIQAYFNLAEYILKKQG